MKISAIDFPRKLLNALREDKLVVFAGAGVSMGKPARLPKFRELAKAVAQGTGKDLQDGVPEDHFLGRLEDEGVKVHARAAVILSRGNLEPTALHRDLLRLYSNPASVRIVTTNFDTLFEQASDVVFESRPNVFEAPALPLGRKVTGIVHVHGSIECAEDMVLTDEDFGRAYLTDGWARRFLVELFRSFTVLFVGYSHSDIIMTYLARALPISEARRFALTREDEDIDRWRLLGIEPVMYPKSCGDKHRALNEGVGGLADYTTHGLLGWQYGIAEIARNPPPLDEEAMDLIDDALSDVTKTRFFARSASHVEWIDWLDRRKHLDSLFDASGAAGLGERDRRLVWWLAEKFIRDHSDELFLLIARHDVQIHAGCWAALGQTVETVQDLEADTLARWVSLLIETAPPFVNDDILHGLGKRCIDAGLTDSLVDIFGAMARHRLVLEPSCLASQITATLTPLSDGYTINELWEEGLKPALDQIAEPLLAYVVQNLTKEHRTFHAWRSGNRYWDPTSAWKSAIERHGQDELCEPIDVVIDAARDCLEHLASKHPAKAASWCDQLVMAEAPLLRRLAVHILPIREDLTADKQVDWLIETIGLYDSSAHHETCRALRIIYPQSSPEQRRTVIEAVLDSAGPGEEHEYKNRHAAYQHFSWLHWLSESAPNCEIAKQALKQVQNANPSFEPREHPDLSHGLTIGSAVQQRAWTVEELLSRPASEWVNDLLPLPNEEPITPGRYDLLRSVEKAATQKFQWGLDLADALAESGDWDTDLWPYLMSAWSRELDEDKHREVLGRLSRDELSPKHARSIADALRALVKGGGLPYALDLLAQANQLAIALWDCLDRSESLSEVGDWLERAMNHPAGVLTQFWLESLSLGRKQQDPVPDVLSDEYRTALSGIVQDKTLAGRLGRSVLGGSLSFLWEADENWAKENLLPLFEDDEQADDYQALWDGFLYSRLPRMAELMTGAFLKAVSLIKRSDSDHGRRDRFLDRYTTMLVYFVNDPLASSIPQLFENAAVADRHRFAWSMGRHLDVMSDIQQREWWERWLGRYWKNRLGGVPAPLAADEIVDMLGWLPYLRSVYPEAVELAVRMENAPLGNSSVVRRLADGTLWQKYPQATAELLVHLGEYDSSLATWHRAKQKLIDKLLQTDLPQDLKTALNELVAKLGLN